MSEETDKVMSDASGCDEDEEWLYGGDNEVKPEESADEETVDIMFTETTVREIPTDGVQIEENGKVEEVSESDSDDDDDDDVCVTIGDITTGGVSQYTNFGSAPVNLNIKSDGRAHAIVGTKTKGVDLNAPGSVNGIPVLEADIESFEEKPWRKPGADISDYFNYGFNEDSWKSYCEKQRRTRGSYEGLSLSSAKNMGQQGRSGYGDKESRYDYASLGCQNKSAQRKSSGIIDVIGGQTGSISRLEGRRRHNNEGNNIQVLSEASQDADPSAAKISPFFPPHIPPPPFPPPPHSVGSAPPLIPPPHLPISVPPPGYPPGAPPPSLMQSLNSGHSGGYDGPPMPPFPFPPGVFPRLASWPGAADSAKAWEYYARHGRDRERDKDRSRERGHDKEREQGRDRERESSPSSQPNNSEEEQRQRHRDHGERGYDRHRDRFSRETEERHREKRRRDEGRHKPPRSSSSSSSKRKHGSEEVDSSRRHRHKKTKRSKEDKEERHKLSTDQENQSEPTD